jgi:hypothetical protein
VDINTRESAEMTYLTTVTGCTRPGYIKNEILIKVIKLQSEQNNMGKHDKTSG